MNSKLEGIFSDMKAQMQQSEGLVIRPMIAKRAKQISQKYRSQMALINQKYSALPAGKKRGRRKQSALFRNRVGQKANRLRKVMLTLVPNLHSQTLSLSICIYRPITNKQMDTK